MSARHMFQPSLRLSHRERPHIQLELSMRSEITAISPFADSFMHFIKKCRCVLGVEREVEVALREALANAVVHGNHKDPRKRVYVSCCCETDGVSLVIRDEGQGFDLNEIPDPTAPGRIEADHGRGIYLMRALMDEVRFERGGAAVYMSKKAARRKEKVR
jgi:serine/threonine-protein kinase RsbW